jgi:hypothetical protein
MRQFIRILIVLLALAEGAAWTFFTSALWGLGNAFGGSGDGAGTRPGSGGELIATLLIGAVWFLLISPYACMALGSLSLVHGKSLRVAYAYSLVVISIMTLTIALTFQRRFELMALGNVVAGGLWAYGFREGAASAGKKDTPV